MFFLRKVKNVTVLNSIVGVGIIPGDGESGKGLDRIITYGKVILSNRQQRHTNAWPVSWPPRLSVSLRSPKGSLLRLCKKNANPINGTKGFPGPKSLPRVLSLPMGAQTEEATPGGEISQGGQPVGEATPGSGVREKLGKQG